jgi:hypothetical protein
MILSTDSNPTEAAHPAHSERKFASTPAPSPTQTNCRFELDRVVGEIDSTRVRTVIDAVFSDLLRLLECLAIIERHLRQVNDAENTQAFFQIIHDEAGQLVDFIRKNGLNCTATNEELIDTLDGITFAITHDLQRVFEGDQNTLTPEKPVHAVIGKLYRSHDILTNCLQQSTITLAMMFDPKLEGSRLFDNSDIRRRQSLQLCDGLTKLLQRIENCTQNMDGSSAALIEELEKFRNECLECLMYSDWPQFESFCERIKLAAASAVEWEAVLHQFQCYVETLLGQVKMRAVLADVFPVQFGSDSTPLLSSTNDVQDEQQGWDSIAVA